MMNQSPRSLTAPRLERFIEKENIKGASPEMSKSYEYRMLAKLETANQLRWRKEVRF